MKKHSFALQSGQALMELTVMLLGISAMILAIIMVSGVQLSTNELLLEARFNAYKNARDKSNINTKSGDEFYSWNYENLNLNLKSDQEQKIFDSGKQEYTFSTSGHSLKGNLNIPFTPGAKATHSSFNSMNPAYETLTSSGYHYTAPGNIPKPHMETYTGWRGSGHYLGAADNSDFAQTVANQHSLDAAALIRGQATISKYRSATMNSSHQRGPLNSDKDAADAMYATFERLFGIDISDISLAESESNQVYFPRIFSE